MWDQRGSVLQQLILTQVDQHTLLMGDSLWYDNVQTVRILRRTICTQLISRKLSMFRAKQNRALLLPRSLLEPLPTLYNRQTARPLQHRPHHCTPGARWVTDPKGELDCFGGKLLQKNYFEGLLL